MLDLALKGNKTYWWWIGGLAVTIGVAFLTYLHQYNEGLRVTGLSRDVSWGLYISQLTFLVGVAASAVILVLPYYLHNHKAFGRITVLGEFLAVSAVTMCLLFVIVDLGYPSRLLNLFLYPSPKSVLFWDATVLQVYLILNIIIGWNVLSAERKGVEPPGWIKPLIYISIPWAISIHTVTAFLYAGLPGRHLWLTAVMAPRFLASAFAAGPSLLIILAFVLRRFTGFDAGRKAINQLARVVTYALLINIFLFAMEFFTAFYSQIPSHMHPLAYLFWGLDGHGNLVPWMWVSVAMSIGAAILLMTPWVRRDDGALIVTAALVFISLWIDKGLGLVIGGFIPNPMEKIVEYTPTAPELMITVGIYALGALILTILYKVAVGIKKEIEN
jgi:[DsrC]-trisulfide reductase subunit P